MLFLFGKSVELEQIDLATFLSSLASQLRNDGRGLLDQLAAELDEKARALEAVKRVVCGKCRMIGIAEEITFSQPVD